MGRVGKSVAFVGDVNGDGYDDFLIGDPQQFTPGNPLEGAAYLVFGKPGLFESPLELDTLDGTNGFKITGLPGVTESGSDYELGSSVAGIGDFNRDGFDDFILGSNAAFGGANYSGAAYVVFGKAGGFDPVLNVSTLDGTNGFRINAAGESEMGISVSGGGDVNGDGLPDLIVGAHHENAPDTWAGAAYVLFGTTADMGPTIDVTSLNGANGFRIFGASEHDHLGRSVSMAGDLNGDGFADLIVAAEGGIAIPKSYVIFGRQTFGPEVDVRTLTGADGFTILSPSLSDQLGTVAGVGDVNHDGFDDVIIGQAQFATGTYVLYGKGQRFDPVVDLAGINGVNGFRIDVATSAFSTAGDLNGDGIDDLMIGGYVIFGNEAGFGADFSVSSLKGVNGFRVEGGTALAGAGGGDLNGDGQFDLLVGFPGDSPNPGTAFAITALPDNVAPSASGLSSLTIMGGVPSDLFPFTVGDPESPAAALIVTATSSNQDLIPNGGILPGGAGGDRTLQFVPTPGATGLAEVTVRVDDGEASREYVFEVNVSTADGERDLSELNGRDGYTIQVPLNAFESPTVSNAGDFNGDGIDDFLVAMPYADYNGENSGSVFVVFGKKGATSPLTQLTSLDGANGFRIDGTSLSYSLNASGIGDFNGDGFDDIAIGAPRGFLDLPFLDTTGHAYVIYGKANSGPRFDLTQLNGSNGFTLDGEVNRDALGGNVCGAGDLNGDGFDDVIIGAPGADVNGTRSGTSYVLFGHAGAGPANIPQSHFDGVRGFKLLGPGPETGAGWVNGLGDINGDGFDDVRVNRFVVFGKASGFDAEMDLSGDLGISAEFAGVIKPAGDFNGDGIDDFVFGGESNAQGDSVTGIIFGQAGLSGVVDESFLDGVRGVRFLPGYRLANPPLLDPTDDHGAIRSISTAGDVNGDGFDDIILGVPSGRSEAVKGSAFIVYGTDQNLGETLYLAELNGTNGMRLFSNKSQTGANVAGGGDFNGDGIADILVTAPASKPNASPHTGAVFVVYGTGEPVPLTPNISANGRKMTFTDIDGDTVTVKVSRGAFTIDDFGLSHPTLALTNSAIFQRLSLGEGFAGADLTIKATPSDFGGDGLVNLGFLDASGVDLGKITIAGDLGRIEAGNLNDPAPALHRLKVHSLGAAGLSSQDPVDASLVSMIVGDVGTIRADEVTGTIALKGGIKVAEGIYDSALHVAGALSRIDVGLGMTNSMLTIRGHLQPTDALDARALGSADFGSSLVLSRILVGYDDAGLPVNADVQTGRTKVHGDWTASDLIVGATAGPDGSFGTEDDTVIPGGGSIVARMAKVVVKGRITGTMDSADSFGIVAEEIVAAKLENRTQVLVSGARNDLQGIRFGADLDVLLHEVLA